MNPVARYFVNLLILLDCGIDTVFFGSSPYETMSSRLWRYRDKRVWGTVRKIVDWVVLHVFGQSDHCQKSCMNPMFYLGLEAIK